jgi:zeta-carotene desaturase
MKRKIGIIGGGVAGISAAIELIENPNIHVELFEAKNEIGGRVYSFRDPVTNEYIDNGKHLMVGAYQNLFKLLRKLDTYSELNFQKFLNVEFTNGISEYKLSSGRLGKLSQVISLLKINQFTISEKFSLIRLIIKIDKLQKLNITGLTAQELLRRENQNENLIKHFWEPVILATMNISPAEASSEIFLEVLNRSIFSNNENQKLVFSKIPLIGLFNPISEINKNNFILHKSTLATKLLNNNGKWEILLQSGKSSEFDSIILAVPPKQCSKLISAIDSNDIKIKEIIEFTEKFSYSPILSVYLWSDNDFLNCDFKCLIGTEFHWIFKEKSKDFRFTLTKSNAEEIISMSRKEILEQVYQDLEKCFPEFDRNKIFHSQIIFEKQATIKITPGIEKIRPNNKILDNLFLAGDWTNTKLPATMESAAKSGQEASRQILENINSEFKKN